MLRALRDRALRDCMVVQQDVHMAQVGGWLLSTPGEPVVTGVHRHPTALPTHRR